MAQPYMNISPITHIINHLSDIVVEGVTNGSVGYLCAMTVKQIDPRVGFVCGATIGAIHALCIGNGSNHTSKIVAIAAFIFAPFQVCQKLQLPVTFQATLILTSANIGINLVIRFLVNYFIFNKDQENIDKSRNA